MKWKRNTKIMAHTKIKDTNLNSPSITIHNETQNIALVFTGYQTESKSHTLCAPTELDLRTIECSTSGFGPRFA